MTTWASAKVLDSTPTLLLPVVNIYDDKGKIIQTQAKSIAGGIDVTSKGSITTIDFTIFTSAISKINKPVKNKEK